jgi:hypothetical protein
MSEIPNTAWIAAGAVIAALITGIISLANMMIAKDQRITEFRQAWIDSLRTDVAEFIASATAIPVMGRLINYKQSKTDSQSSAVLDMVDYSKEYLPKLINGYNKIILRLNPKEHMKLIGYLDTLKDAARISSKNDQQKVEIKCHDVLHETQKILKEEWERVKHGEIIYRITKWLMFAMVVLLLIISIVGAWYAITNASTQIIQESKEHSNAAVKLDAPQATSSLPPH